MNIIFLNRLFQLMVTSSADHYLYEKLKCIICYFKKVTSANSGEQINNNSYSKILYTP